MKRVEKACAGPLCVSSDLGLAIKRVMFQCYFPLDYTILPLLGFSVEKYSSRRNQQCRMEASLESGLLFGLYDVP